MDRPKFYGGRDILRGAIRQHAVSPRIVVKTPDNVPI